MALLTQSPLKRPEWPKDELSSDTINRGEAEKNRMPLRVKRTYQVCL